MGSSSRRLLYQSTLERPPRPFAPDHLRLVESIDRLGESVVIAVADTANGRFKACFGEALGVLDGHALRSAVRVTDESAAGDRPAIMQRLFECIENEAGVSRARVTPTDDLSGVDVDDEGDVDEAWPCGDIGKVADSENVRRRRIEVAIYPFERAWRRLVAERGAMRLAADDALQSHGLHQP